MNIIHYKGYTAAIEFDEKEEVFVGKVLGIKSVLLFEGESAKALKQDLQEVVDEYLAGCEELGREPEKPFSGKFTVRLPSDLHARVAIKAKTAGKSLNAFVTDLLSHAAET